MLTKGTLSLDVFFFLALNLWVSRSKKLSASFFAFLLLCHFPDSFKTIIRRALLAATAAGQETRTKEREREKETRGGNKRTGCTASKQAKDCLETRCILLLSLLFDMHVQSVYYMPVRQQQMHIAAVRWYPGVHPPGL